MIFASLYQSISQISTAFAFAALLAIAFAAGLLKEFNPYHQVTFGSDPVSAFTTCQKTTKKEKDLLFYSSVDFERFEDENDCLQAY